MTAIQAVIFDLDNTILDRTATFGSFVKQYVAHYLGHVDQEQSAEICDRIIVLDQDGYKDKRELFAELREVLPWMQKPELSELLAYYETHYVSNAHLMADAVEVLSYLRDKYKLGMITNGRTLIQYGKIERLGLRPYFDRIVVSEEAGVKKPDARIFEQAVQQLELAPECCIYVGDHPANDIEGASRAGLKTIWMQVNQPWQSHITATPKHAITQLKELLHIL